MALQIVLQPSSVLVDQSASSVTFSVSAIDPSSPSSTVTYQWRTKDVAGTDYTNVAGATSPSLVLSPIASFDNDTFVAIVSGTTVAAPLSSNIVTYGIRLSSDKYSEWETPTETGVNRVRRLQVLGYL